MKPGTGNRAKVAIMFALAVAAAFITGRWNLSGPNAEKKTMTLKAGERAQAGTAYLIELDLGKLNDRAKYRGSGRNIFRKITRSTSQSREPTFPPKEQEPPPASVPSGLKFFGFAARIG